MLKEAIELLLGKGQGIEKAKAPVKVEIPNQGRYTHFFIDGKMEKFFPVPIDKAFMLTAITDIPKLVANYDDPAIWVGNDGVRVIFDSTANVVNAYCHFVPTTTADFIQTLQYRRFNQEDFIRVLRNELRDRCREVATLLPLVRKLKWRSVTQGQAQVQHGSESLGSSIEREVSGFDGQSFPEELHIATPIIRNLPFDEDQTTFLATIEVSTSSQQFVLNVDADQKEFAKAAVVEDIADLLKEKVACPVYYGVPFGMDEGD